MSQTSNNLFRYRELILTLAWKNIAVRYKQAYLGVVWSVLKPLLLMFIFTLVKGFVGIETQGIPYPVLTFAALIPWVFFQESASEGVNSVTSNAALIKKIYFPREVFPLTAMVTKLVELLINCGILAVLMIYYQIEPTIQILWIPLLVAYVMLAALAVSFFGAAANVYYRDVTAALPVALSLAMYASPVIYPLALVKQKLIVEKAAGEWSDLLYQLYLCNPLAGIIDAFQNTVIKGAAPDWNALMPGFLLVLGLLPIGSWYFKRAESYFADVI